MPRVRQYSSVADIEGRMNTIIRGIKHSTIRLRNVLHEKRFIINKHHSDFICRMGR